MDKSPAYSLAFGPSYNPALSEDGGAVLNTIAAGSRILQIGTSLTDNGFQLGIESASTIGPTGRGGDAWARALTGMPFDWVNKGISGDTIQLIEARLPRDVYPEHPDVVIVEAGTNNSGETYETIIGRLTTLYAALTAQGYTVIPLTVAMRESGSWNDTVRDKMLDVNTWIKANYPNAIEINKYFTDPATDRPYANFTDDGTHWSNEGGYAVGKAIAEGIVVSGSRDLYGTAINTTTAALTGTSGSMDAGITGSAPTGIHLDIVGGHSGTAVATALEPGLQMVFTPGGSASTEDYDIRTNPLDTTVVVDTIYELLSQIQLSAWDGWAYVRLRLYDPTNTAHFDLLQMLDDTLYPYPDEALDLFLRTAEFTAVDTGVRLYIQVGIDPNASGTGTLTIDNLHLQEWTRPALPNVPTITSWAQVGNNYTGLGNYSFIGKFNETDIVYADAANNVIGRLTWDGTDFSAVGSTLADTLSNTGTAIDGYDGTRAVLCEYISATQITLTMLSWNGSAFEVVSGSPTTLTVSGFSTYPQIKIEDGTIWVASGSTLLAASWNGSTFDLDASLTGLTGTRCGLAAFTAQTCSRWNETNDTHQYYHFDGSTIAADDDFKSGISIQGASLSGALGITALENMRILGWANTSNTVESFDIVNGEFYENGDDSLTDSLISSWPRSMTKLTNELVAIHAFGNSGQLIAIEATTS